MLPGCKPSDAIKIDVMGFSLWAISDAHMNYVSREHYEAVKRGLKKEWASPGDMNEAVDWLMGQSVIHTLGDGTAVYDFEGETPEWISEAFDLGVDGTRFTWNGEGRRLLFEPGESSSIFMMAEAKKKKSSPLKPGESKTFDQGRKLAITRNTGSAGLYTAMTATRSQDFKTYQGALAWLKRTDPRGMERAETGL